MTSLELLRQHVERWIDCKKCPLHHARNKVVFSRGHIPCDVLFVGEAPGHSEDEKGWPFFGPAGMILDQIVDKAIGQGSCRDFEEWNEKPTITWAFTNLCCCLPTDESGHKAGQPMAEEILACGGRLREFVQIARPRLLVAVGDLALDWLPKVLSGYEPKVSSAPLVHIPHPSHLLRMQNFQLQMAAGACVKTIKDAVKKVFDV